MTGIVSQNVGRASGLIKAVSAGGTWTLIKTLTASSDSSLDFVDGTNDVVLDGTYPIYLFKYINLHPANDLVDFQVNFRDGGSSYDATKTSTVFGALQLEDGSAQNVSYSTSYDLAQGTGIQFLASEVGNDNDQSVSGYLYLFAPSDTTFVKHYYSQSQTNQGEDRSYRWIVAGYCNVTAAIDAVQFTMQSGNIDSGKIKLYGIGDS